MQKEICGLRLYAHRPAWALFEAKGRIETTANAQLERRQRIAAWVAREILPLEASLRAWLRRSQLSPEDIDDVIQECYCQLARLDTVDHIERPRAYLFGAARNLLGRRRLRARVVPIDAHAEMDIFEDEGRPSPEQLAAGRLDLARLRRLMAALPARCRTIVELRKLEGWSQKEIAAHLGVTEKVVEKQVWQGIRAIRRAWDEEDSEAATRLVAFEASVEGLQ